MGRLRILWRGAVGRCPRCGGRGLFHRYFTMVDRCPTCGLSYEREEGYWLGAMAVNIVIAEVVFGAVFLGGLLLTWPEVPWTALLIIGLVVNALVPILYYPLSKTVWVALDLFFHPPEPHEEADAATAVAAREPPAGGQPRGDGGARP